MPEDLALEASDTLALYQALEKHAPGCAAPDPQTFFGTEPRPTFLVQKDIIRYESALKEKLVPLIEFTRREGIASSKVIRDLQDPKIRTSNNLNTPPTAECFKNNLIFLLSDLHVKGELVSPAY
jgi:hypothetical protein